MRRLFVDETSRRMTILARLAPGVVYPPHVHAGLEECYVLEGDLWIGDVEMRAGDYQRAEPGSNHGIQSTRGGCLLLLTTSLDDEVV